MARARAFLVIAVFTAGLSLAPATASAADDDTVATLPAAKRTLSAPVAQKRDCLRLTRARGADTATWTAPMSGYATVRLHGRSGSDWDLAVYDAARRRYGGSSSAFGSNEVVQGWVSSGQKLLIQGCRRSGRAKSVTASVVLADIEPPKAGPTPSLVRVKFGDRERFEQLERLGVDVTHRVRNGHADVIVAGDEQLDALRKNGFSYETEIADMNRHYAQSRRTDARLAAAGGAKLPSGERSTYRTYEEVQLELKAIAEQHGSIVKPMTLPRRTLQGRALDGIEIAADVHKPEDGRPVFFLVGMHHAREWPSVETAMEFAWTLAKGYRKDARITKLLERERIVIVPIINADGYVESRRALDPVDQVYNLGVNPNLDNPTPEETDMPTDCFVSPVFGARCDTRMSIVGSATGTQAYRRKNCNGAISDPNIPCVLQYGVDPNRNYGQLWGGPGSDGSRTSQTYRGTGPWSEPETAAVHEYSQTRQVTNIISIHNVAALILRPPGLASQGFSPDEKQLKEIGDRMAAATGYTSQYGWQLYDVSGSTEDWNYAGQGAFGYTIEIGPVDGEFHMPYQQGFVDQWDGTYAENGKGLREALLIGAEAAADRGYHSVIAGAAPAGAKLRLRKQFNTQTSPHCQEEVKVPALNYEHPLISQIPHCINPQDGEDIPDHLDTSMVVGKTGLFVWHVNPSTRPFETVPKEVPGTIDPEPYRNESYASSQETRPSQLPQQEGDERPTFVDHPVAITSDTQRFRATLDPPTPADDYDLEWLRREADGTLTSVTTAGNAAGLPEELVAEGAQVKPGDYVLRVNNYLGPNQDWSGTMAFYGGEPPTTIPPRKESWTLTCETPNGATLAERQVFVDRGKVALVDLRKACKTKKKK